MTKQSSKDLDSKSKKPRKKRKDPRVLEEFFEDVEITDPDTGKKSMQKVKVVRYKLIGEKKVGQKGLQEELELEEEYED